MGKHDRVEPCEVRLILELRRSGLSIPAVAARTGRHSATVDRVLAAAGGLPPRRTGRSASALRVEEREEISRGLVEGLSFSVIARRLGRHPTTISREVNVNGGPGRYRAWAAERRALDRATRPKVAKLAGNPELRAVVEGWLEQRWSPEQIALRLRQEYPHDPEMWVSHETIYQSLYVQARGGLRKDLTTALRTGRTRRVARANAGRDRGWRDRVLNIVDRPAEVADRAVPGHWEGDLLIGKDNASAIAVLVERTSSYVLLCALPDGHDAEAVRDALVRQIGTLPDQLWKSITWDQGSEMARHHDITIATGIDIYFCDPHSPWQKAAVENTNGLLRQYFPKSTHLEQSQLVLDAVAFQLNDRPRKRLNAMKPWEKLAELVALTA